MARYDVVVVGAGPAGAAAAAHLARGGAKVLLCDRARFPRDKACGGGLTPRAVAALGRLGIRDDEAMFARVGGMEMVSGARATWAAFPSTTRWPAHGLVARRIDLDAAVCERAVAAGAELRTGVRVLGPLIEDGVCRGVRAGRGEDGEDVRAGTVIAADGATSVVARGAGLAPTAGDGRGFWYTALRGYAGPVEPRRGGGTPLLEFYPLRTPSGRWLPAYGWVFPLPGGAANVGVDLPHRPTLASSPSLREAYGGFLDTLRRERPGFADAVEEAPPVGALLPEAMHGFRPGAPGLLLVGDAAGLITPYSGEGIAYALESAEVAASAVLDAKTPSGMLRAYEEAIWDAYGFQFRTALWFMKAMRRPPLARAAAELGLASPRVFRAAVRIMAYLIEEDRQAPSTVSGLYRAVRSALRLRPATLWR